MLQCKIQYYKTCREVHTDVLIFYPFYSHPNPLILICVQREYFPPSSTAAFQPTSSKHQYQHQQGKINYKMPPRSFAQDTHTSCWIAGWGILLSSVFSCPGTWHTVFRLNNRRLNRNKSLSIAAEFV